MNQNMDRICSFNSGLVDIHLTVSGRLAVIAREDGQYGNVFSGWHNEDGTWEGYYTRAGHPEDSIWCSAMQSDRDSDVRVAIGGDRYIHVMDLGEEAVDHLAQPSHSIDWLSRDVLAYGCRSVRLWDVRTNGATIRFQRTGRSITGIVGDQGGNRLVVSDNYQIEVFDVRMASKLSLFSWPHVHEGPQLQAAKDDETNSLTAVDRNNQIQVYVQVVRGKCTPHYTLDGLTAIQVQSECRETYLYTSARRFERLQRPDPQVEKGARRGFLLASIRWTPSHQMGPGC